MAGAVAGEEHAVLGRGAQPVREPVALVADGVAVEPLRDVLRRLLDVVARLVGADADALLAVGGHRPGVAVADQAAVDPDVEVGATRRAGGPRGRGEIARVGRLDVGAGAEDPAPAERVDDQRGREVAAVGVDRVAVAGLRPSRSRSGRRSAPTARGRAAVVEARPAPRQPEARRAVRRVERHARDLLPDRALDAHRVQPRRRRRAGADVARSPIS